MQWVAVICQGDCKLRAVFQGVPGSAILDGARSTHGSGTMRLTVDGATAPSEGTTHGTGGGEQWCLITILSVTCAN